MCVCVCLYVLHELNLPRQISCVEHPLDQGRVDEECEDEAD